LNSLSFFKEKLHPF